jgi:hypothetical protein
MKNRNAYFFHYGKNNYGAMYKYNALIYADDKQTVVSAIRNC